MQHKKTDFFGAFKKKSHSGRHTAGRQKDDSFSSVDIDVTDLKDILRQMHGEASAPKKELPVTQPKAPAQDDNNFVSQVHTFEDAPNDIKPLYTLKPQSAAKTISKEDIMREIREKARAQVRSSYTDAAELTVTQTETIIEEQPAPTKFHETLSRVVAQDTPIKETIFVAEENVGTITLTETPQYKEESVTEESPLEKTETSTPESETKPVQPISNTSAVFKQEEKPVLQKTNIIEAARSFVSYIKQESSKKAVILFVSVIAALILVGTFNTFFSFAYAARVNGVFVGTVHDKKQCETIIAEINNTLTSNFGENEKFNHTVSVSPCVIPKNSFSSDAELRNAIYALSDKMLEMHVIYAGKTQICALGSREAAEEVLQKFKDFYTNGNEAVEFSTDVPLEIRAERAPVTLLCDVNKAFDILNGSQKTEGEYTVKSGDTLWAIARNFDTTVDDLLSLNPNASEEIRIGDTLRVMAYDPIVAVTTVRRIEYDEDIKFTTEVVETDTMYRGRSEIVQKGKNGERHVTADLVKVNGLEVRRDVITETVTLEPVTQIKHVGTKAPPKGYGTGTFIRPCSGTISSYFGTRRSGYHKGIDIANSYGTPIRAADNGIITFAGWDNTGFGRLVKINHQNGYISYYGHNSSIKVRVGQTVNKGDIIAYMGSTGNSTGNHCHFELYRNGQLLNPYSYIF